MPATLTLEQKEAIQKLWSAGVLVWKLDAAQKVLHADILAKRGADRMVALCSRGWGKTFTGILMAIEACLQKPNAAVAFVTKTKRQARANIRQSVETILEDCPRALRPKYLKHDYEYTFKNGSVLELLGTDSERFDLIRGRGLDGVFIDESQDIDDLDYVIRAILDPAVLRKDGWMVLAGTVPQSEQHDFVNFIREAQGSGFVVVKDIVGCPRYTPAQIEKWKARAGGEDSDVWQREYMCRMVFTETRQVIPEWTTLRGSELTQERPRPEYCDKYVGLDFGFARDLTIAVFGYYDFAKGSLVIEDELVSRGVTTGKLSVEIEAKMLELWGPSELRGNVRMFADGNEPRTIYEMRTLHGLRFQATEKGNKLMHINALRLMVADSQLFVHPRCKTLLKTLYAAAWNKNFKSFDRDDEIGHADALDALLYLSRNVKKNSNPFPEGAQHWTAELGFKKSGPTSSAAKTFAACYDSGNVVSLAKAAAARFGRRRL